VDVPASNVGGHHRELAKNNQKGQQLQFILTLPTRAFVGTAWGPGVAKEA